MVTPKGFRNGETLKVSLGQGWPELLGILVQLSQAPIIGQRESAFRIFSTTPAIIEKQHADSARSAFSKAFKDDAVEVMGDRETS